jgi:outer membrane protein TolC
MKQKTKVVLFLLSLSTFFNPLKAQSLQQLYDLADHYNQQIVVSQTGLRAASEAVMAAKNAMLPNVELSASGSYIGDATLMSRGFSTNGTTDVIIAGIGPQKVRNGRQETPHWGNSFTAQVSQVIYAGGAIRAGIRITELGEQMATLDVEKNRQEVRFLITGYYLDLYKLQNQQMVIDRNIQLTEKVIKDMEARCQQGMVLKNDITRYELQLMTLQLTKEKLKDAQSIINHQLCTTLYMTDKKVIVVDTTKLNQEIASLKTIANEHNWQQMASENNIGIRQADVAIQLAEQKIKTTNAASLPSLALIAEDNLFGPYTNDLIPVNANVNAWFVGIGLKYDLGSLWKNKHTINHARIHHQQSQEQLVLARENVEKSVQAGYVNFLTSFKEVETQRKQVELATQNYDVVQNRYQNQLALLTDMLDASSMKLSADMALVNAQISLLYNYYKLKYISNTL